MFATNPISVAILSLVVTLVVYLVRINILLSSTPDEIRKLAGSPWTEDQLKKTYRRLQENPVDYSHKMPPKLDRRYVVTGGSGLVGGYIVLQLLARGNPPESIRILDIRRTERNDMKTGPATEVDFVRTDITSPESVEAAFSRPWPNNVARLPLTVFHTAAVIIASDNSPSNYSFPESVNVGGTANLLRSARRHGADVFSYTSSGSISILPVRPFSSSSSSPMIKNFWQLLDTRDFFDNPTLRSRDLFFGNYPATKAEAERLVCDANDDEEGEKNENGNGSFFRTGAIRPANGVYGNPTDNTVGDPLSRSILPTWVSHITQSFVHGSNVALAHLHHEAALLSSSSPSSPLPRKKIGGRPFVITDPNPPIRYADLYLAIRTLSRHPFRTVPVPPVIMLLLAHFLEWYAELSSSSYSWWSKIVPEIGGDARHLRPGLFSITTHLVAVDDDARKPVREGGLGMGHEGYITTEEGIVGEVLEWNREHEDEDEDGEGGRREMKRRKKVYTTSISLAEKIRSTVAGSQLGRKGDGIM